MSGVPWGQYPKAYKAIWEKLDELTKALESIGADTLRVKSV